MKQKVCDIAKERGVKSDVILAALAAMGSGISHHLAMVDEDTQNSLVSLLDAQAGEVKAERKPDAEVKYVKFWCKQKTYKAPVDDKPWGFADHIKVLEVDDPMVEVLRDISYPEIWEVKNEPYEDDEMSARFDKMLTDLVFTGASQDVSGGGIDAIRMMFSPTEQGEFPFALSKDNARRFIRYTVDHKSLYRKDRKGL